DTEIFFFSSRRRHTRFSRDWSSDVCSSDLQADLVVAEVNNGGDFIGHALRNHRPTIRYREVRATRGKLVRAEPVAGLYELGRMRSEERRVGRERRSAW